MRRRGYEEWQSIRATLPTSPSACLDEALTPVPAALSPEALRAAAQAQLDGVELSHDLPLTPEAELAALVDAELDRVDGLLFTATPRIDLLEVARWQHLADQVWCAQLRQVVATTCRMTESERDFAGDEIALAMGLSPETGRELVWFAGSVAALPGLLEAVEAHRISSDHVRAAMNVLLGSGLTLEQRQAVVLIALARYSGHTPQEWATLIRRLVMVIDPEAAQRRKDERTVGRRVDFYPIGDEQGALYLQAPLEQVAAAQARIQAEAAALKAAGDERTMDQLRTDVALSLLTHGVVDGRPAVSWTVNLLCPVSTAETDEHGQPQDGEDQIGEIPGWGPILPATARDLATHAAQDGGTFHQVLVDETGMVVAVGDANRTKPSARSQAPAPAPQSAVPHPAEPPSEAEAAPWAPDEALTAAITATRKAPVVRDLASLHYRPPIRLVRFLELRDRTCVFPGCRRPAARTDKDHRIPWPRGSTSQDQMQCLCRRHHRAKHTSFTLLRDPEDGTFVWITRAGWWFRRPPQGP